jgi:hypothetical protein
MAKRRVKKRTHVQVPDGPANTKNGAASMSRSPKSMVIRVGAGEVGSSVSQLVKDFRLMMEPDTASRLKVGFRGFYVELFILTVSGLGTSSQQAEGLHGDGWSFRGHTSDFVFQIKYGKHEHANGTHSSWTDVALQSGELFPVQGRRKGVETSQRRWTGP